MKAALKLHRQSPMKGLSSGRYGSGKEGKGCVVSPFNLPPRAAVEPKIEERYRYRQGSTWTRLDLSSRRFLW